MAKKRRIRGSHFVMLDRKTLKSQEWKSLSKKAKLIYIYIKANYNGHNNGEISFKYNEVNDEFSHTTISEALKELIRKEWIKKTRHGGLHRYYCLYKLTGRYDRIVKTT